MASEPNLNGEKEKTGARKKASGKGAPAPAAAPSIKLKPITETLQAALSGDLAVRVGADGLAGESAQAAALLNELLEKLARQIDESDRRKQVSSQEIDQAIDALIALVRQGDLSRWNSTTEDPQLGPLLEGF